MPVSIANLASRKVTFPINATRALLAPGGLLHTVIDAECDGECMIFFVCRDIGMLIKLSDPFS